MHWVFVIALGLSLVVASGGCSSEVGGLLIVVDSLVALGHAGSVVVTQGLGAPQCMESSQIRDRTCVSCIGRPILYHWNTGEVLLVPFYS